MKLGPALVRLAGLAAVSLLLGVLISLLLTALLDASDPPEPLTARGPSPSTPIPSPAPALPATPATATGPGSGLDLSSVRPLAPAGDLSGLRPDAGPTPLSLGIPSLGVDGAAVVPVGVEPDGSLQVPGPSEVGWYRFGASPPDAGSSVLAAHIAYDGVDGVFRHLAAVEPGATVTVTMSDGNRYAYRVMDVTTYTKAALPVADLFDPTGPPRLVLITCGGTFDASWGHYDSNVVAIAAP